MPVADVCAQVGLGKGPAQHSYNAFQHYLKLHKGNTDPKTPEPSTCDSLLSTSPSTSWNTFAQHEWETTKKKIRDFYPEVAEEAQHAFKWMLEQLLMISHPNRREGTEQPEHL